MVKAIPIVQKDFISVVKNLAVLGLFSSGFIGLFVNIFKIPGYVLVIVFPLLAALTYYEFKHRKYLSDTMKHMKMELDNNQLRLINKHNECIESLNINDFDRIQITGFFVGVDTGPTIAFKKDKNIQLNNISFIRDGEIIRSVDFILDSFYMKAQLSHTIRHWSANGKDVTLNLINE
jgi:hypothetical protein